MMKILDCTLRDGANVVGMGFDANLTKMMIEGLIKAGITTIEMGNAHGIGTVESSERAPLSDIEYLDLIQPYLPKAEIGMFMLKKYATQESIDIAAKYGLKFLRVGANAGDGAGACEGIRKVKAAGLKCRYSLMKAYVLSAEELAEEARMLSECGLDEITIMDSAGTMMPDQVEEYVKTLVAAVDIPVGFHGHNNLGLSVANALAAQKAGATVFDTGLLGMARSAGNCATELLVSAFQRNGWMQEIDLYELLNLLDEELIPAMKEYDYKPAVCPLDLILGYSGCHSGYTKMFMDIASQMNVSLYKIITEVSKIDRKAPSEDLIKKIAIEIK
jgi:4-hydroxy-2-oxovalerate aldolase